jgi:hypothetical protein
MWGDSGGRGIARGVISQHHSQGIKHVVWIRGICFILTRIIVAPAAILAGLAFILLPFAFATMQDPDKPLSWSEYLGVVFRGGGIDWFVYAAGLIAIGVVVARVPLPGAPGKAVGPGDV